MNKRDVMKADGSSHCLFDLPCPSKVREPLLMRCDVGWIYVKTFSSNRQELSALWVWAAESHINCPLPDSSRPLPSRYPPLTLSRHTHTDDDLTWLCATHVISLGGGGLWELARTRVAGEGQQTVSNSRPWWEMLGVRRRAIPKSGFFFICLCSILC